MNIVTDPLADFTTGVAMVHDPVGLRTFLEPECAAAILHKQTPEDIQLWLDRLDPARLPIGRVVLPVEQVREVLEQLCQISQVPHHAARDWLIEDIVGLAHQFAALVSAKYLRMRLDVVTHNACRKFHVDMITSRLVCTYRGQGTQYGIADGDADPSHIFTVGTGSPILLRGSLWPAEPASALVHRSPPIEGTGQTRLVLVLDPVTDPKAEG